MTDNSTQNGTDMIRDIDRSGSGPKTQVFQLDHGGSGSTESLTSKSNPLPTKVCDTSRTYINLYAQGAASGTTGTETIIQLIKAVVNGAAGAAANQYVPTSGKRFRITTITVCSRGNATATAQVSAFALRVSATSTLTTSSNQVFILRTATPATASAWDRVTINFEGEGPEIVGDGTLSFGMTANAVFVTNAPTWDVLITGYEYTP